MAQHRIFTTKFSKVYPLYVQKAERKNRTKAEVDRVICWLTGYSQAELQQQIDQESDFETFFAPSAGHSSRQCAHQRRGVRRSSGRNRRSFDEEDSLPGQARR